MGVALFEKKGERCRFRCSFGFFNLVTRDVVLRSVIIISPPVFTLIVEIIICLHQKVSQ